MKKVTPSKIDFSNALLPSNRRKQFFFILKYNWRNIFAIGLLISLFALPLLICHITVPAIKDMVYSSLHETGKTDGEIIGILSFYTFISDCVSIFAYMLLSIPFMGGARIIRNIVYDQGVLFKDDFLDGIKMYHRPFLFCFFIYGLFRAVLTGINLVTMNYDEIIFPIIIGLATVIFYLLLIPLMMIYTSQYLFYDDSFLTRLSNSLKLFIGNFVTMLLFIPWLMILYYLLPLIDAFIIRIIVELVVFIIGCSLFQLIWHLYMVSIFDKAINKNQYPEIYRKGLSK